MSAFPRKVYACGPRRHRVDLERIDWNPKHVSLRALEVVAQTETLKEVPQIDEQVPHGAVREQSEIQFV